MSELISGKEALIALANGENVEACVTLRQDKNDWHWFDAKNLTVNEIEAMETEGDSDGGNIRAIAFRMKPRTITINCIEVPAPFEPEIGEVYWHPSPYQECGYDKSKLIGTINDDKYLGMWRTEEEIKQVVAALRSIFNAK